MKTTPFSRILIANRGEIARRIQRTAHHMGFETVAVHSVADANSPHVRAAGRAVCIGEPLAYLDVDAIVQAARLAGADAVHPGYGFLAENAAFARACREAGLVFIGPAPEAIDSMGHKARAKRLMEQAGVPCVPGYSGPDQDAARMAAEAARIGFPVMIKAVAGGGGRGMRLAEHAGQFAELLRSARSEAQSAFGSAELLLEKAVLRPRHIEIQIFADRHGHAVHLGERDCSVQRRHQKLIEEAPSPAVSAELRARMGQLAVQAVLALGYEGAGTLEFLLDATGHFYFMEMNTRLQVEHPVTECITGLDLVEWQLRVAAGEKLPLTQEQVQYSGHAIEVRLCAEDAADGFLPQSGQILHWQAPEHARTEHALEGGMYIAPHYDSMLAKIVAHGRTREEARRKLLFALQQTQLLGVTTNQAFLHQCLAHPAFVAGSVHTGFVDEHRGRPLAPDETLRCQAAAFACALLCADPQQHPRLTHRLEHVRRITLEEREFSIRVRQQPKNHFTLDIEGVEDAAFAVTVQTLAAPHARLMCGGVQEPLTFCRSADGLHMHWRGRAWQVLERTHAAATAHDTSADADSLLRASMSGRVVALHAAVGDLVQVGQALVTLEAMKMEHIHSAPRAGRIAAIHASVGEQVSARRVLAEIAPGTASRPDAAPEPA